MRIPIVAGNWKMNKTIAETTTLLNALRPALDDIQGATSVVCPPFSSLPAAAQILQGSRVGLGAQNMHWEEKGAFTGELAPNMVAELCQYVILGHSERRQYFAETDATVNKKIKAALAHGLVPIFCIGENLAEFEADQTTAVVRRQVTGGLEGLTGDQVKGIVVAYEPIWAIGTGEVATPEDAQEVCAAIRTLLAELYSGDLADGVRVLYGGSVKSSNIAGIMAKEDVDGALVGGASLDAAEFAAICRFKDHVTG